jgi:hypothetical protein
VSVTAKAVVSLTVEVLASSCWGAGTTIDQIHKQAIEDALNVLRNKEISDRVRVVGKPAVVRVITECGNG